MDWETISETLSSHNIDAYAPATHVGECKNNYVVVRISDVNDMSQAVAKQAFYDIMCYIPVGKYHKIESFVKEVKAALDTLTPVIKYEGAQTPEFFDEKVQAYMVSFRYVNYRK